MEQSCLNCKHAKWRFTRGGNLHPSGDGWCGWQAPKISIPSAFYWLNSERQPAGGHITRRSPFGDCPTWEAGRTWMGDAITQMSVDKLSEIKRQLVDQQSGMLSAELEDAIVMVEREIARRGGENG